MRILQYNKIVIARRINPWKWTGQSTASFRGGWSCLSLFVGETGKEGRYMGQSPGLLNKQTNKQDYVYKIYDWQKVKI